MKDYILRNRYILLVLLALVLVIHYGMMSGLILSNVPIAILNQYTNLIIPASFTFWFWIIIYIGIAIILITDLSAKEESIFILTYRHQVKSQYVEMFIYHILWLILWSEDQILFSLIIIAAYTRCLIRLMKIISQNTILRSEVLRFKIPVGLYAGWLVVMTLINFVMYLASIGINVTNNSAIIWSSILLLVGLIIVTYFFVLYGNQAVMLPMIWFFIGLFSRYYFLDANQIMLFISLTLLIVSIGLYVYLLYLQYKQNQP